MYIKSKLKSREIIFYIQILSDFTVEKKKNKKKKYSNILNFNVSLSVCFYVGEYFHEFRVYIVPVLIY